MIDIVSAGNWFTWSNGRTGIEAVWKRLDRAICNMKWIENFPNTKVEYLPVIGLDHSPISVNNDLSIPFKPRPFRFECMRLGEQQCRQIVTNVWQEMTHGVFGSPVDKYGLDVGQT